MTEMGRTSFIDNYLVCCLKRNISAKGAADGQEDLHVDGGPWIAGRLAYAPIINQICPFHTISPAANSMKPFGPRAAGLSMLPLLLDYPCFTWITRD